MSRTASSGSATLHKCSLVAADALVPSSFTSILAFWRALDTYRGSAPEKTNDRCFGGISWKSVRVFLPHGGASVLKQQHHFPRKQSKCGFPDSFFVLEASMNNLLKNRQRFIIVSCLWPHSRYFKSSFCLNKSVVKTESFVGSGCFYSLRCLKSARSTLNMSVIPSAVRDSFRSTSASALNLNMKITLQSHLSGGS